MRYADRSWSNRTVTWIDSDESSISSPTLPEQKPAWVSLQFQKKKSSKSHIANQMDSERAKKTNNKKEIHCTSITCKPILTHDISNGSWRLLKCQLIERAQTFLLHTLSLFKGFRITGVKIFFYMFRDSKIWANQVRNPSLHMLGLVDLTKTND